MPTWMINGPGQALFVGRRGVSQFDPTGQVSPGSNYIPDEVAKQLVKEAGLRKSDTVSKRLIVGYLESMGLSAGLAPEVAMVLRNSYGVTPTFDESTLYAKSGALVEELMSVVNESYPAPFRVDEPEILSEMDEVAHVIYREYMESEDDVYDVVLESLAEMSPHDVLDIMEFYEWVTPEGFAYLADLVENGPEGLADEVLEGICSPDDVMSEDVGYHVGILSEIKAGTPETHPRTHDLRTKLRSLDKAKKEREGRAKAAKEVPSFKKQMKMAAKDRAKEDPLAKKAKAMKKTGFSGMLAIKGGKEDHAARQRLAGKKAAKKQELKTAKQAARKEKGQKALDLVKRAGSYAAKKVGQAAGAAAQGAGYMAGRYSGGKEHGKAAAGQAAKSATDQPQAAQAQTARSGEGGASSPSSSSAAPAKKKDGLGARIAKGVGRAARAIYHGVRAGARAAHKSWKGDTPGIQDQAKKAAEKKGEKKRETGSVHTATATESFSRQGHVLNEMRSVLDRGGKAAIPEPADVFAAMECRDLVGQAVIESLAQLDWDQVAQIASIALLPTQESYALVVAAQDGSDSLFHEWREVSSRVEMPSALTKGSFRLLGQLSLDESIVPRLIGYSVDALAMAGDDVAACVEDAYPDLGKSVYGPAGDPRQGPETAKSYMSPYRAGTDAPAKGQELMTTRMFSDPDVRDKERSSRLSDVLNVLRGMHQAATDAGVDPEGMFLNTYRDLHREKARYS